MIAWLRDMSGGSILVAIGALHIFPILPLAFVFTLFNPISFWQAYVYALTPFIVFGIPFLIYAYDKDRHPIEKSKEKIFERIMFYDTLEEKIKYVEDLVKKRVVGSDEVLTQLKSGDLR